MRNMRIKTKALNPELLRKIYAYWRCATAFCTAKCPSPPIPNTSSVSPARIPDDLSALRPSARRRTAARPPQTRGCQAHARRSNSKAASATGNPQAACKWQDEYRELRKRGMTDDQIRELIQKWTTFTADRGVEQRIA